MLSLKRMLLAALTAVLVSAGGVGSAAETPPAMDMNEIMKNMMQSMQGMPGANPSAPMGMVNPMANPPAPMGMVNPMANPMMNPMAMMNPMTMMMPMMMPMMGMPGAGGNPMVAMVNPTNWVNPAMYAQFLNPNAYAAMMNPMSYMAFMNPALYGPMMNPGTYMQFMNPAMYTRMMDPNAYAAMMNQVLSMFHAGDQKTAENFWQQWMNLGKAPGSQQ